MLSYNHEFHAGNHADVLKHIAISLVMRHLNKKDKPYCVIDTHAGSGYYDLTSTKAKKNSEFKTGITKIAENQVLRKLLPEYYSCIDAINDKVSLKYYPGSACYEVLLARGDAHIFVCDLHKAAYESLVETVGDNPNVTVMNEDGFGILKALLPPIQKRGLITIDPSYELEKDYDLVIATLKSSLARFSTGIYLIWYPVLALAQDHSVQLIQRIRGLNKPCLQAEVRIKRQDKKFGMCGSGVLVLNYPYGMDVEIDKVMSQIVNPLAVDATAQAKSEVLIKAP